MAKPSQESFYAKMNHLAGTDKKIIKESNYTGTLIDFEKSEDGTIYGVIKENHEYYIKKSTSKNQNLDSADFAYIGGLENKNDYRYFALGEAQKQRNFLIKSLNEAFSLHPEKSKVNETKKEVKIDDPFKFLRGRITEGKSDNKKKLEEQFKKGLSTEVKEIQKKSGLLPEIANVAIKKALGKINEEAMVTADSNIKEKDVMADKTGKEKSQAPINDENAKKEADKATAEGDKDYVKVPKGGKSIAVNQSNKNLKEEASPLVTDDSQLIVDDSPANEVGQKHEPSQAPINDTNAKSLADKARGTKASDSTMPNNTEESEESDPMTKKEDADEEKDDLSVEVSESVNKAKAFFNKINEEKAISTEDSEESSADEVDNKTEYEKPQAPYNNYNQPAKGQKEKKGTELKNKPSKKDVVAESEEEEKKDVEGEKQDINNDGKVNSTDWKIKRDLAIKKAEGKDKKKVDEEALVTADSEENPGDSLANKTTTNLPNKTNKSEIVADSEENPDESLANDTKTNLPNPIAEAADALDELMEDNIDDKLNNSEKELNNMPIQEPAEEPVPQPSVDPLASANPNAAPMDQNAPEEPAPELGNEPAPETGEQGEEPAPETGENEEKERDAQSKIGEFGEIVDGLNVDPETKVQWINQFLGSLDTSDLSHNDDLKIINKLQGKGEESKNEKSASETGENPSQGGLEDKNTEINKAIDDKLANMGGNESEGEVGEAAEPCAECGTFEDYAVSRGYNGLNECGSAELANLLSSYINAYKNGENDGDFPGIIVFLSPEMKDELADYGHGDYLDQATEFENPDEEKLSPGSFEIDVPDYDDEDQEAEDQENAQNIIDTEEENGDEEKPEPLVIEPKHGGEEVEIETPERQRQEDEEGGEEAEDNQENEGIENESEPSNNPNGTDNEDTNDQMNEEELDEFGWRDIKNAGAGALGIGQKAGSAIGNKVGQAQQALANKFQQGVNKAKEFGKGISQTYNKGVANSMIADLQQDASKFADTLTKYNNIRTKAGQEPLSAQSVFMQLLNQLNRGEQFNLGNRKIEGEEPEKVMEFAPDSQNLGVIGSQMGESEQKVRNYIKKRLEEKAGLIKLTMNENQKPEKLKLLDKMIDEQWGVYQKQIKKKIMKV